MFRLSAGVLTVALICALGIAGAASSPNEQLPAGAMQEKASAACLTCHEARIILQQRLGKPAWTREMDKMVKWGAVVDPQDRDALIDYFSANFGPDQPAYVATKSSGASVVKSRSKPKH